MSRIGKPESGSTIEVAGDWGRGDEEGRLMAVRFPWGDENVELDRMIVEQ
jgi:hypothetical protein